MLKISKLTDYATVILSYLMQDPDRIASATAISGQVHLAVPTVSKILKILAESGLVISFRGTGGGYQLARAANEITLASVVTAIEGRLAITECCEIINSCVLDSLCSIKDNWKVINKMILQALDQITLSDMGKPLQTQALKGIPIVVKTSKA